MALGVIAPLCASLSPVLAGPEGCSRGRWRSEPSKWRHAAALGGRGQGAPRTCRCIETIFLTSSIIPNPVREHHAPVGALRLRGEEVNELRLLGQGAPRTCRCIETLGRNQPGGVSLLVREHHAPVGALRHQGNNLKSLVVRVREHHAPVGALSFSRQGWWRGVGVAGAVFCGVRVGPGSRMAGFRGRTAGPDGRGSGSAVGVLAESRFRAGRALSGACLVVWWRR